MKLRKEKLEGAERYILSTFAEGRIYSANDVRNRLKDRNHHFTEGAVRQGIRKLIAANEIEVVPGPCGGKNKTGQAYRRTSG